MITCRLTGRSRNDDEMRDKTRIRTTDDKIVRVARVKRDRVRHTERIQRDPGPLYYVVRVHTRPSWLGGEEAAHTGGLPDKSYCVCRLDAIDCYPAVGRPSPNHCCSRHRSCLIPV